MADPVTNVVADKIVDLLFGAAKREIDYVRNCTKNVDKLRNEAEKLKDMRSRIQQRIDIAKGNGEALLDGVQKWMMKADTEISKVEEFLEEEANAKKTCFNLRVCVNLGTLHHYGKMAINKTLFLLEQQEEGRTHESCVSFPTATPRLVDLYQTKNLDDIHTQKSALEKIIEALADESIQMVGINGSGGVGKTTLAKEVAVQVKNLFADIVFITVSQTVDAENIQKDVEKGAKRIMNGEKVLIILDDIWDQIDLPDVGIPCGKDHMNCKILLTSRRMNVCEGMNVDRNISVNTLTKEEAWVLFKRIVGDRLTNDDVRLEKIAREVTEECGGLPLIIQAVGNALKNKPIYIWEAALDRLQKHAPLEIAPEIRKAFTHLKLSYNLLESKEAKSCFLLCSMFKEDGFIDMERLAEYGIGMGIFDNPDSIKDARKRVQIVVDTLTSSGLLLSERRKKIYPKKVVFMHKMHDVVRDVALLITSSSSDEGEEKFLVKAGTDLTEWQPRKETSDMSYTKISLMDNHIEELPADHQLHFPLLDTFLIRNNDLSIIPDDFFRGMKKVKVLDMSWNKIVSLPQSLKLLTKLITFDLTDNMFISEISILGDLKSLEILRVGRTSIKVIPKEIGQLTNLRLLDADCCEYLSDVTPGVISKLTWLEELYIGTSCRDAVSKFVLMESLTTLHLTMPLYDFCDLFPEDTHFEKLPEFLFRFYESTDLILNRSESDLKRRLHITKRSNFPFTMAIKKLLQVSDGIELVGMKGLDNIIPDLISIKDLHNIIPDIHGGSIEKLQSIELHDCKSVSCLVKITDEEATQTFVTSSYDLTGQRKTKQDKFFSQVEQIILYQLKNLKLLFDCSLQYISLRNLQDFEISDCSSLFTLFPLSVAQGLSNLRTLYVRNCKSLMVVISEGEEQTEDSEIEVGIHDDRAIIVFPSLTHIHLGDLPQLKSFYSGDSTVKYPSLEIIDITNCPSMKKWGYGVHDIPNINFCHEKNLHLFH